MKSCNKKYLFLFLLMHPAAVFSQEMPVLSPGFTNSFLYNPALAAGTYKTTGTVLLVHKSTFTQVAGHPVSTVLSASLPLKNHKIGLGANLFHEKINVFQTTYFSPAFAYSLNFNKYKTLAFGLSTDLYYTDIDLRKVNYDRAEINDPELSGYSDGKYYLDFSLGINYYSRIISFGATVNRVVQLFKNNCYYSAYARLSLPVAQERDVIEPLLTYRQLPFSRPVGNLGLTYSYKNINRFGFRTDGLITGGVFVSTNMQLGFMAGFKVLKRVQLTYNYETSGKYQHYVGPSHEISLVLNIIDLSPMEWYNEYLKWYRHKNRIGKRLFKTN
ncbi:MAG: PorP/SprF family type IX secretion system membrane protein [Bacteroidales bacterium]|nr:PorP/SprF family type IX secretion system membrane protein [Bacteroidales bacterium]